MLLEVLVLLLRKSNESTKTLHYDPDFLLVKTFIPLLKYWPISSVLYRTNHTVLRESKSPFLYKRVSLFLLLLLQPLYLHSSPTFWFILNYILKKMVVYFSIYVWVGYDVLIVYDSLPPLYTLLRRVQKEKQKSWYSL